MAMITAATQTQVTTSIINRPQLVPVIIVGLLVPCLYLHLVPPPLPAGLLFILMVVVQRMVDLVPELVLEFIGDLEIQSRFGQLYLQLYKILLILQCSSEISEPKYARKTRIIRLCVYTHTRIDLYAYAY